MKVSASTGNSIDGDYNSNDEYLVEPMSSGDNDYYWENTGECLPKAIDYEDESLLKYLKKGDIIFEAMSSVNHSAIVEGVYYDTTYKQYYVRVIESVKDGGVCRGLERAYREGKIRALGISNFDNRMEAFNAIMDEEIKPQIMQIECHPFAQRVETRKLARQYGIQVECWYPLGHADQRLLNSDVLENIASTYNKSVVQIIIRWHIQEGFSVIPGSTNPDHIQENIEVFDFELTEEQMEEIRAMNQGERGRYFNLNYERLGSLFTGAPREWTGTFE